jgi:ATP-dependent helicase/nuclease subunit A
MSQKKINWTTQQSRAIEEHRRSVFVSASAGTGKTAVLSGSCVDVVRNASACPDVWSILVVTFTDMAAEQMRSRIAQQLNSAIESSKEPAVRQHLRRQLILLGAADVSTIHSFCKQLITGHFYKLELDPTFAILDADEAKLLKAEVLEKTIDYGWKQSNLADALRQLFNRRDLRTNEGFPARIIEINDFLDGVVSRDDWLTRAQMLAESTNPFATDLAESQKQIIEEKLQDSLSRLNCALNIYRTSNPTGQWAEQCKRDYINPVQQCLDQFKSGHWEFERPRVSKPTDVLQADFIAEMVGDALNTVRGLKTLAILNPDYLNKFAGAVSLQTMVLVELVRQFDKFYAQAKKTINCLDFADLEHYALRLLGKRCQEPFSIEPSETALAMRQKYKYLFVDECQDINHVQQAILDMLSSPGNVFAVGDPKQSIYRWRGARPEIFLEHLKRASTQPKGENLGLRVDLNVNFRSVKPILDFVNRVFSRIMTASFTSIDYDASAHLQPAPGNTDAVSTAPAVELHILDKTQTGAEQDDEMEEEQTDTQSTQPFTGRQLQAAMIAQRIKQMVGADTTTPALHILDKLSGRPRPVEYRDIVILMRSLAGKNDFVETLRLSGIPVSCEATAGYFEATEITDMLSLLKVLDNPRRDIELAAVLRCHFFGLTDSELARIRLWGKKDNRKLCFYDCVLGCSQSADDRELADKLTTALTALENWRTVARRGRLAELIWHIYRRSGFLSFVCALPDGPARRANLLKLHDRAIQFEGFAGSSGVPSLTRFIEFVEKLLSAGQDWAPAEPESAAGNAVRILSVHKSKGLEFPVVFVADLDGQFSKKDSQQDCLVDEQSTLGLRIIDADSNSRLDSLAYQVIERHARRSSLAEEMRILYVAMTRAMDRLILVGCKNKKNCQNILTASLLFGDRPVPHWHLETCRSHLDWILCALSNHPLLHQAFQTAPPTHASDDNLFHVQLYAHQELAQLSALVRNSTLKTQNSKQNAKSTAHNLTRLKESINWRYPFGDAPLLPAKRTVTQWTHRNDEFARIDYSLSFNRKPKVILSAEKIDGRSIGTATHLVISQLNLDKPVTAEAIQRLIDKLPAEGASTQSVASQIDAESIVKFFQTELAQMALDKNNLVWREWPFTFSVPASQWVESAQRTNDERRATSDDSIIVQGIIDLLIKTPKGLLVIDFKTDDVSADQAPQRAELYRPQLDLYARAAAAITGQNVLAKWLCFLKSGRTIKLTSDQLTGNQ